MKKILVTVLSILFSVVAMADQFTSRLDFPSIKSTIQNSAELDLNKVIIQVQYVSEAVSFTKMAELNPATGEYTIPAATIPYGQGSHILGNYFKYTVTAYYKGDPILRMSDINVWTWEKRGYSLEEFKRMYVSGLSTLSLEKYKQPGELYDLPFITGSLN